MSSNRTESDGQRATGRDSDRSASAERLPTSRPRGSSLHVLVLRLLALFLAFSAGAVAMWTLNPQTSIETATVHSATKLRNNSRTTEDSLALSQVDVVTVAAREEAPGESVSGVVAPALAVSAALDIQPGPAPDYLRLTGHLEPAPGRLALLPLATSQPIAYVDVRPGDRVEKGWQVFSHWESPDRLQALKTDVAKNKKLLELAQSRAAAATQTLSRYRKLQGILSPQELADATTATELRRQEMEVAELAVEQAERSFSAAEFEFAQAFVTSPIEGIVAAVDIVVGERRQVGTRFRGVTVLDPRVLVCRCGVTDDQLKQLRALAGGAMLPGGATSPAAAQATAATDALLGVTAFIESAEREWPSQVLSIGVMADAASGLVPVLLEVQNPRSELRPGIEVQVRFERGHSAEPWR